MTYTYSLIIVDDDGNIVIDHPLTPDAAVKIIADALANKIEPKTESEPEPEPVPVARSSNAPAKKKNKCGLCGKRGHTARRCDAQVSGKADEADRGTLLTEDQFDDLKQLQKLGDLSSSKDFADNHGLPIAQVNRAINSRTFDEYHKW
jgi:hypothetical protein